MQFSSIVEPKYILTKRSLKIKIRNFLIKITTFNHYLAENSIYSVWQLKKSISKSRKKWTITNFEKYSNRINFHNLVHIWTDLFGNFLLTLGWIKYVKIKQLRGSHIPNSANFLEIVTLKMKHRCISFQTSL